MPENAPTLKCPQMDSTVCGHAVDTCIAELWILPTMKIASSGGIVKCGDLKLELWLCPYRRYCTAEF